MKGPEFTLAYTLYFTHLLATIIGGTSAFAMIHVGLDPSLMSAVIYSAMWVYSGNLIGFIVCLFLKRKFL